MTNLFEREETAFGSKEELYKNKTRFCILSVELKNTKYGEKWFVEITHGEVIETLTWARAADLDKAFQQALDNPDEHLPQHNCYLRQFKTSFGSPGYRPKQQSGGGPCPCSPGEFPVDPFAPEFDELPLPTLKP